MLIASCDKHKQYDAFFVTYAGMKIATIAEKMNNPRQRVLYFFCNVRKFILHEVAKKEFILHINLLQVEN